MENFPGVKQRYETNCSVLLMAASVVAASAQTPAAGRRRHEAGRHCRQPAAPAAKRYDRGEACHGHRQPATAAQSRPSLPPNPVPPLPPPPSCLSEFPLRNSSGQDHQKDLLTVTLHYQEIKIGAGAVAEPNKMYKVFYTGYRKPRSQVRPTDDHPRPR